MAEVRLENVVKEFNGERVVNDISFTIQDGSFTVLVGPSGCGKSTTLRMIAGLEKQTSGDIYIDGTLVNEVPPSKRDIAMVFQNYALYPTMTVRGNIEFGLKNMKIPRQERKKLVEEIVEIVGLTDHLDKKPDKLSGGQRQRVALARAMVKKPKVFILDEPLSNLDAKLRTQMRTELIELHQRLKTTFIYVTHDQVEAMSMGDEIVILNSGIVQQKATPVEIYEKPSNIFAAEFIGTPPMNVFSKEAFQANLQSIPEEIHYIGFRPEDVEMIQDPVQDGSCIVLESEILTMETLGAETIYKVKNRIGEFQVRSFTKPIGNKRTCKTVIPIEKLYPFDKDQRAIPNKGLSVKKGDVVHVVG